MTKRKKLVIANWKMNKNVEEAVDFVKKLEVDLTGLAKVEVVIAAPFTNLPALAKLPRKKVKLAAQNLYFGIKGPFTGEISATMLKPLVDYVIVGHSERRRLFGENNQTVNEKIKSALNYDLKPIICFGETAEQKEEGQTKAVIEQQLSECLADLRAEDLAKCILAYEPVWAISTVNGSTGAGDNPENSQVIHKLIRHLLTEKYGSELAASLSIIYGGSVNPSNAENFLSMPDIDGGLVGGASLHLDKFFAIIKIAKEVN